MARALFRAPEAAGFIYFLVSLSSATYYTPQVSGIELFTAGGSTEGWLAKPGVSFAPLLMLRQATATMKGRFLAARGIL